VGVTTGLWARNVLAREYGVDLGKITWVLSGDEHVAEYRPPANVVPIEAGKKIADLLVEGELAAAIGVEVDHPNVGPLIANASEAGFAALKNRGHYPINHLVVVKDELLAANPMLAADLFNAFAESKRVYVERLKNGTLDKPTPMDAMHKRVMEITGRDPLPYGIEPNRAVLQDVIESALEQGIITERVTVDQLFAESTRTLIG
jgi:4,5-dihydroxyphthalate decarboxylase